MSTHNYDYGQIFDVQENITAYYLPKEQKDIRDKMPTMTIPKGEQLQIINPKGEQLCIVVKTVSGQYWWADENKFYIPAHEFYNYEQMEALTAVHATAPVS